MSKRSLFFEHPVHRLVQLCFTHVISDSLDTRALKGWIPKLEMSLMDKPTTKRYAIGIKFSAWSTWFDITICFKGRRITQKLCEGNIRSDDTVSDEVQKEWKKWTFNLPALKETANQRCIRPADFLKVLESSVHFFQMHLKTVINKSATWDWWVIKV